MEQKSHIKVYWLTWLSALTIFLVLRFTIHSDSDEDTLFQLFTMYMIPTWLSVMALNFVEGRRLTSYLKKHHYQRWCELTSVPVFGINNGGQNSFRMISFLRSKDLDEYPNVKALKKNATSFICLTLVIFFTAPIIAIGTMIPWNQIINR